MLTWHFRAPNQTPEFVSAFGANRKWYGKIAQQTAVQVWDG